MPVLGFDLKYKCVVCRMKLQTFVSSLLSLNVCLGGIRILETISSLKLYWI